MSLHFSEKSEKYDNQILTIMSKVIYFKDAEDYNRQVNALYEEWNRVEWIQRIGENKAELFCSM